MSFARRVPGRACSAHHEMIEDEQTGRGKFSCERARGPRAVLGNSGSLHHQNGPAQGGCAGAASSLETKGLGLSLSRESAAARTNGHFGRLIPARLSADGLPRFENRVRYLVVLEVGVSVIFYRCSTDRSRPAPPFCASERSGAPVFAPDVGQPIYPAAYGRTPVDAEIWVS